MKNSEKYYAQLVYELRDTPLLEKTVLFIESYDEPVHGDCEAILSRMSADERFSDWKFFWALPSSIEYDPDKRSDLRISYVSSDSHDFVKACEEVKIIITAERLPEYYIKKDGQLVIGCFPISFFDQNSELSRSRTLFQITLEKLDVLYIDNEYVQKRLDKMYPEGVPFQVLYGIKPRFILSTVRNDAVAISLSTDKQGEKFSDLEKKYKDCRYVCVQYDKDVCFHVDKALYRSFQDENEPEILEHIISRETPFCKVAKNAKLIITDRILNAYDAVQMHIPCIYISNTRFLPEYFSNQDIDKLFFADNWKEVIKLLTDHITDEEHAGFSERVDKGIEDVLKVVLNARKSMYDSRKKGECWIIPGDIAPGFWEAMKYYKQDDKDVSILVRSSSGGILWKRHIELSADKKVFCKIGMCALDQENGRTKTIIQREWKRMVGEKAFQTVYLWKKKDAFWSELYQYVPANYSKEVDAEKIASVLYNGIVKNYSGKLAETDIDGKKYFEFGRDGNTKYYLKAKSDIDRITVIFVNKSEDLEEYNELTKENDNRSMTYICIDRYQCMDVSEVERRNNVYWIPKNVFPLQLLSIADAVYGYSADCIFGEGFKILK